jgi:hypothetical protein
MKERPPLEVVVIAIITSSYAGWLFADVLPASKSLHLGTYVGFLLGLGILQGFEISRAWLVLITGITSLYSGMTGIGGYFAEETEFTDSYEQNIQFAIFGLNLTVFLLARSSTVKAWCNLHTQEFKYSLRWAVLFFSLGLMSALPLQAAKEKARLAKENEFNFSIRFDFHSTDGKEIKEDVRFCGITDARTPGEVAPKIKSRILEEKDGKKYLLLSGTAQRPFTARFTAPSHDVVDYRIAAHGSEDVSLQLPSFPVPQK